MNGKLMCNQQTCCCSAYTVRCISRCGHRAAGHTPDVACKAGALLLPPPSAWLGRAEACPVGRQLAPARRRRGITLPRRPDE